MSGINRQARCTGGITGALLRAGRPLVAAPGRSACLHALKHGKQRPDLSVYAQSVRTPLTRSVHNALAQVSKE